MVSLGRIYLSPLYNLPHPVSLLTERQCSHVTGGGRWGRKKGEEMRGNCGRSIFGRLYLMVSVVQNIPQGTFMAMYVVIGEDFGLLMLPLLIFKSTYFRKHWSNEEGTRFKISCYVDSSLFDQRLSPLRYGHIIASFWTGKYRRDSRWQRRCLLHRNSQFHWE